MKIIACLPVLLLCGCANYKHTFTSPDGTTDTTKFIAFIYTGNAGKIRTATRTSTNYNRTVSVGTIEGAGDSGLVAAITAGVIAGFKNSQGGAVP